MSYVYHYKAESKTTTLDGIVRREKPMLCMADYEGLKDILAEKFYMRRDTLVISSLTFLHQDEEKPHAL